MQISIKYLRKTSVHQVTDLAGNYCEELWSHSLLMVSHRHSHLRSSVSVNSWNNVLGGNQECKQLRHRNSMLQLCLPLDTVVTDVSHIWLLKLLYLHDTGLHYGIDKQLVLFKLLWSDRLGYTCGHLIVVQQADKICMKRTRACYKCRNMLLRKEKGNEKKMP